jgi:hypothetical protein
MQSLKIIAALLVGVVITTCFFALFSVLTRPKMIGLNGGSLKVSVVNLEGQNFILVIGPPFGPLGAHQYIAYSVTDEKVEINFFVTRLVFPNEGAFQSDWPLLISQNKFLKQRVRLTCRSRNGEELVATILGDFQKPQV